MSLVAGARPRTGGAVARVDGGRDWARRPGEPRYRLGAPALPCLPKSECCQVVSYRGKGGKHGRLGGRSPRGGTSLQPLREHRPLSEVTGEMGRC